MAGLIGHGPDTVPRTRHIRRRLLLSAPGAAQVGPASGTGEDVREVERSRGVVGKVRVREMRDMSGFTPPCVCICRFDNGYFRELVASTHDEHLLKLPSDLALLQVCVCVFVWVGGFVCARVCMCAGCVLVGVLCDCVRERKRERERERVHRRKFERMCRDCACA